jgi:hypothetical protein
MSKHLIRDLVFLVDQNRVVVEIAVSLFKKLLK